MTTSRHDHQQDSLVPPEPVGRAKDVHGRVCVRVDTEAVFDRDVHDQGDNGVRAQHLSQQELAMQWRISPRTLERWRATRSRPPWLRVGRRIVNRLPDVIAFECARLEGSPDRGDDA